jgi:hypothetical protein
MHSVPVPGVLTQPTTTICPGVQGSVGPGSQPHSRFDPLLAPVVQAAVGSPGGPDASAGGGEDTSSTGMPPSCSRFVMHWVTAAICEPQLENCGLPPLQATCDELAHERNESYDARHCAGTCEAAFMQFASQLGMDVQPDVLAMRAHTAEQFAPPPEGTSEVGVGRLLPPCAEHAISADTTRYTAGMEVFMGRVG